MPLIRLPTKTMLDGAFAMFALDFAETYSSMCMVQSALTISTQSKGRIEGTFDPLYKA